MNYFSLFKLPTAFEIDLSVLDSQLRALQTQYHPDVIDSKTNNRQSVDEPDNNDERFESQGVNLFVDPKSMVYLNGLQMDYVKEGLNEGFKFTNPNQKGECGCGESFTV